MQILYANELQMNYVSRKLEETPAKMFITFLFIVEFFKLQTSALKTIKIGLICNATGDLSYLKSIGAMGLALDRISKEKLLSGFDFKYDDQTFYFAVGFLEVCRLSFS